jgi:hypothetical protein
MKYGKKTQMPPRTEQPEALKKALEKARTIREVNIAKQTVDALTAINKKSFKVKVKHG